MELNIQTAELALREASESNPGAWADHSRYVAEACKNIASHCKELSSEQAYIFGLLHDIGRYAGVSSERHLRTSILRELLGGIGENVAIDTPFHCDYGKNIFLGNDVIINMNCTFVDNKTIRIGDRVLIASNVQIYTSSHPVLPPERFVPDWRERQTTFFRTYARPIKIENNVWIGGGCILLPGVTIGENSVIGAGSVVTHPIPPNCVAVGNPCRVIRYFDTDRERRQHEV